MRPMIFTVVLLGATAGLVAPALAQPRPRPPQQQEQPGLPPAARLMAKRAAEADAYRKLVEQVKGLQVTSETSVRDFVTEYDKVFTQSFAEIKGVKFGEARYIEDGTVEIDARIPLQSVITHLEETHRRYYKGDRYKAEDFQKITQYNKIDFITVTGNGAIGPSAAEEAAMQQPPPPPPQEPVRQAPPVDVRPGPEVRPAPQVIRRDLPEIFVMAGPRERLKAKRAATADAYRKLAEQIKGLQVTSETSVRDFVTEYDKVFLQSISQIRGAKEVGERYIEDGVVEIDLEVTIQQVVQHLEEIHRRYSTNNTYKAEDFKRIEQNVQSGKIKVTGNGALAVPPPPPVDAQPQPEQPAPRPRGGREIERREESRVEVTIESAPEQPAPRPQR